MVTSARSASTYSPRLGLEKRARPGSVIDRRRNSESERMRGSRRSRTKYPLATVSTYGPDNTRATKLVVGILRRAGQENPDPMRSWTSDAFDVRRDPVIAT